MRADKHLTWLENKDYQPENGPRFVACIEKARSETFTGARNNIQGADKTFNFSSKDRAAIEKMLKKVTEDFCLFGLVVKIRASM